MPVNVASGLMHGLTSQGWRPVSSAAPLQQAVDPRNVELVTRHELGLSERVWQSLGCQDHARKGALVGGPKERSIIGARRGEHAR